MPTHSTLGGGWLSASERGIASRIAHQTKLSIGNIMREIEETFLFPRYADLTITEARVMRQVNIFAVAAAGIIAEIIFA